MTGREEQWEQAPEAPRHYPPEQQRYDEYGAAPGYDQHQGPYPAGYGYENGGYENAGYDTGSGQYPAYGYQSGQDTGSYPTYGYGYDQGGGQYAGYGYQAGYDTGTGSYPAYGTETGEAQQAAAQAAPPPYAPGSAPAPERAPGPPQPGDDAYRTEEFAFVDDQEDSSQDVIDWLKFSETRGERRDERRRRIRSRLVWVVVALVLAAGGGVGYLFAAGKLSLGGATGSAAPAAPAGRQVVAVYLRNHVSGQTATALLVSNPAAGKGTAVLVPETLQLPQSSAGGSVQLGNSWDAQGSSGTQDGLNTVLGTGISGTWRLDDSFLATLVDVLGGITVNADTAITQNGKPVVAQGSQTMNGTAAEAYATYQAKGESRSAQLARFGQVLAAVVKAFPTDSTSAIADVDRMGAVLDPSLPEKALGSLLASLSADSAKGGYSTATLPVSSSGALGNGAAATVQQLLGGRTQGQAGAGTTARVVVANASGSARSLALAQAAVENGGYTLVSGGGSEATRAKTEVFYADPARKGDAEQLAGDLGLTAAAAAKGTVPQNADVLVVLGSDYKG